MPADSVEQRNERVARARAASGAVSNADRHIHNAQLAICAVELTRAVAEPGVRGREATPKSLCVGQPTSGRFLSPPSGDHPTRGLRVHGSPLCRRRLAPPGVAAAWQL